MKDPVRRMKRKTIDWEKIFVCHISGKELVSKVYEALPKLNSKKTKNPKENRQKAWGDIVPKKIFR